MVRGPTLTQHVTPAGIVLQVCHHEDKETKGFTWERAQRYMAELKAWMIKEEGGERHVKMLGDVDVQGAKNAQFTVQIEPPDRVREMRDVIKRTSRLSHTLTDGVYPKVKFVKTQDEKGMYTRMNRWLEMLKIEVEKAQNEG